MNMACMVLFFLEDDAQCVIQIFFCGFSVDTDFQKELTLCHQLGNKLEREMRFSGVISAFFQSTLYLIPGIFW